MPKRSLQQLYCLVCSAPETPSGDDSKHKMKCIKHALLAVRLRRMKDVRQKNGTEEDKEKDKDDEKAKNEVSGDGDGGHLLLNDVTAANEAASAAAEEARDSWRAWHVSRRRRFDG